MSAFDRPCSAACTACSRSSSSPSRVKSRSRRLPILASGLFSGASAVHVMSRRVTDSKVSAHLGTHAGIKAGDEACAIMSAFRAIRTMPSCSADSAAE